MPKGLDTMLYKDFAEDGVEVSGGEAQKIAIARALYKDAPFIILDEPTAALDPIAEAEIYEKFNAISGDRTAIYISHRLVLRRNRRVQRRSGDPAGNPSGASGAGDGEVCRTLARAGAVLHEADPGR